MKQETLEEVAENYNLNTINAFGDYQSFIDGAKWQMERMYSDEIIDILDNVRYWETCPNKYKVIIEKWFETYKKK